MHEIVTIQLGSQANHLASHFWNAQESYFTYSAQDESPINHDIHFRAGIGADGTETYTPRTVVYDFKRNFGSLRRINELYETFGEQAESNAWGGATVAQREPAVEPSSYQQALAEGIEPSTALQSSSVRYWSDYTRTYYHPRSLVQIYETDLDLGQRAFDDWHSGVELFGALEGQEDLIDRDLRVFAEECDQMQGLQLLTGVENAWAGFSARYLDRVRDEYGKLPVWVWGLGQAPGASSISRGYSVVNQARAVYEISTQATTYIPITAGPDPTVPWLSLDKGHAWQTSALQETGLESVMLATRLKAPSQGTATTLDHLSVALSGGEERRISQLSLVLDDTLRPTKHTNGDTHEDHEDEHREADDSVCDLLPKSGARAGTRSRGQKFAEVHCVRGKRASEDVPAQEHDTRNRHDDFRRLDFKSSLEMPLLSSFPRIYSLRQSNAKTASVRSSLQTTSAIGDWVRGLDLASRLRVGADEREELSDGLRTVAEAYAGEGSDDGDDGWDD